MNYNTGDEADLHLYGPYVDSSWEIATVPFEPIHICKPF